MMRIVLKWARYEVNQPNGLPTMKTTLLAVLAMATTCIAGSPLDSLVGLPPMPGDTTGGIAAVQMQSIAASPMPLELPAEAQARQALISLRQNLIAAGRLTPELDAQITAQYSAVLAAEAARIQQQITPQQVVIIR